MLLSLLFFLHQLLPLWMHSSGKFSPKSCYDHIPIFPFSQLSRCVIWNLFLNCKRLYSHSNCSILLIFAEWLVPWQLLDGLSSCIETSCGVANLHIKYIFFNNNLQWVTIYIVPGWITFHQVDAYIHSDVLLIYDSPLFDQNDLTGMLLTFWHKRSKEAFTVLPYRNVAHFPCTNNQVGYRVYKLVIPKCLLTWIILGLFPY